jgi:hypothetical protein
MLVKYGENYLVYFKHLARSSMEKENRETALRCDIEIRSWHLPKVKLQQREAAKRNLRVEGKSGRKLEFS